MKKRSVPSQTAKVPNIELCIFIHNSQVLSSLTVNFLRVSVDCDHVGLEREFLVPDLQLALPGGKNVN